MRVWLTAHHLLYGRSGGRRPTVKSCGQPSRGSIRKREQPSTCGKTRRSTVESKQLGNTGVMIPEIGIGVWRYSGGVEPLRRGIEQGATLIDTAEVYGTEEVVGEAVRNARDKVFIATKVSGQHLRHDEVLRSAEASLRRLNT